MMDVSGKRVLITGGSGFLGRHVVAAFERRGCRDIVVARKAQYDLTRESDVQRLFAVTKFLRCLKSLIKSEGASCFVETDLSDAALPPSARQRGPRET